MGDPKEIAMIPTERDLDVDRAYRLGCIVGAAIVAWGDAMRGMLERGAGHADDLAARMIRETHKRLFTDCRCATCWYGKT